MTSRRRRVVTTEVVDYRETSDDEKRDDVEAWGQRDPVMGRFTEKVWMFFGSLVHSTEVAVGVQRWRYGEGVAGP